MASERLVRSDRLRVSRDFQRVARQGTRTASREIVMLVAPARGMDEASESQPIRRIGITASRKVGGAVVRNRFKRRVRDWFRRSRAQLPEDVDVVVIARPGAARLTAAEIGGGLSELASQQRRGVRRGR